MSILYDLIKEDYDIKGNGRWYRSVEHSSLVYDASKDKFYFNSTDIHGDAYIYLTQVRKWGHDQAKEFLRVKGFSTVFIQEIKDGKEVITYPPLVDAFHENIWEADRTYFYNRLITDDTIRLFKLGYFNGYYTIPIFVDGVFRQIQMRRDSPKLIRNWYKDVGPLLFNTPILQLVNTVYITEGLIGAILLSQNSIPSVAMNIGSEGFQASWIKYFTRIKKVYILFDNDSAGNKGAIKTAYNLGLDRCTIYNFWDSDTKGYAVDDYFLDGGNWEDLRQKISEFGKSPVELPEFSRKW